MKLILSLKIMTAVLVLAVVGLIYQATRVVYRSYDTNRDIAKLKAEVDSLQAQQKKLEGFKAFIQTDFFAEKEARLKLGMQKEGEHVVVLPPYQNSIPSTDDAKSASPTESSTAQEERSNPMLWWEYFFARESL